MASYDLKAILGEKLRRLTDKTLKALVDCMCAVGASLCSLDKRVSALESVELPEGGYKPMQEPLASPSASGTAIQFIDSISQDATGRMTATKKTVRTATASQTGVTKVYTSTGDSTDGTMTRKAISEAIAAKQPERLVVTPTESGGVYSNDFATISAAVTAGKDVWLCISGPYDNSSYFHYVPLSEAVFKNGAYIRFIFARPRSYETDAEGIIDTWTCTETSPYWTYSDNNVYYATTSGTAATAGTANSASNANLGKTTDATNGDVLYIGGGTQQRIENAGHANSAKDYDQTGSIATALASKQPTVVFYGTSVGGTLSDPAISKTMYYAARPSHVIAFARNFADTYDDLTGNLLSTVELDELRCLDELFLVATNRDSVSVDKGVSQKIIALGPLYTGGDTPAQIVGYTLKPNMPYNGPNGNKVPVNEHGWRQHVVFELSLINTSLNAEKIYLESGGAYRSGTGGDPGQYTESIIFIDGTQYGTPGNPSLWSDNYRYRVAIGSVPASGSRTWQIEWWKIRHTGSSATYYETEYVMVTTIK